MLLSIYFFLSSRCNFSTSLFYSHFKLKKKKTLELLINFPVTLLQLLYQESLIKEQKCLWHFSSNRKIQEEENVTEITADLLRDVFCKS